VITALVAGTIAFGWHPAATPFLTEIPTGEATVRLLLATGYVVWTLMAIVAFSFMISTMTDVAGGAIGAAISLAIGSQILDGLNAIGSVRNFLPTHYWSAWAQLFLPGGSRADMVRGSLLTLAYVVIFGGIALWWFRRKDILS
jgi:ABC-2 type transport system permease protein